MNGFVFCLCLCINDLVTIRLFDQATHMRGINRGKEILELRWGAETLAKLEIIDQDLHRNSPWVLANVFPSAAFQEVRELFRAPHANESSRILHDQLIEQQIALWLPDFRKPVRKFTLVVDGEQARFKFDEDLEGLA